MWSKIRMHFTDDETPWCAAAVGAWLEDAGIRSTRSAAARSYHKWGVQFTGPAVGSIVVFWRGSPTGPFGHVGIVVGRDQFNNVMVLGGNQGDEVNIRPFSTNRVLSYRWPSNHPIPARQGMQTLPIINSSGQVSTNEQ